MPRGSWIWDSKSKGLLYTGIDVESETPGESKNEVVESKTSEEDSKWQREKCRRSKESSVVVIADVKDVVVDFIQREKQLPRGFRMFVSLPLVDELIIWTLRYFCYYFELRSRKLFITGIEAVANQLGREYTLPEIQLLTNVSLRCMGQTYCNLVLGVDSAQFHHLKGGKSYLSCTLIDRALYEVFYTFLTDCVWVAFGKKEHEVIQYEVNRLFRSDEFNPFKPPLLGPGMEETKGNLKKQYRRTPLLEAVLSSLGTEPASEKVKPPSFATSSKYDDKLPSTFAELREYIERELEHVGVLGKNRDDYDSDLELIND